MLFVTRGLALLLTLLATLVVALPAAADSGLSFKGNVLSVSSSAVSVKDAKGVVTTCARVAASPALDSYAPGNRVQALCVRAPGHLVLVKIRHLGATTDPTAPPSNDAEPTKFAGAVTALTDTSITLHDGDRDLTCSIGASSPSVAGVKVGQHVKVSCSSGALVAIAPVTPGEAGRAYAGTVSAVDATSITVHTPHGDGTCSIGDGSPSVADLRVGDAVLAGCKSGTNQLVLLKRLPAPPPAPTPTPVPPGDSPHGLTGSGTISALATSSVSFHNAEHDLTCSVGASSPRLGDYKVGDKVRFGCVAGALVAIAKDDSGTAPVPPPPPADGHTTLTVGGMLTALSASSLTVHGEHGDVSCTVSPTMRLGDFHVGDHVGMACVDGALLRLVKLT